jgi:predicted phage-related endonuclease
MESANVASGGRDSWPYDFVVSADDEPAKWLQERCRLITATDVPAILGVPGAPHPLEVWYRKQEALDQRSESEVEQHAKHGGHDFEDANAQMFSKKTGRPVVRSQNLLRSKRWPWLGCTVDYAQRLIHGEPSSDCPLELKNAGSFVAQELWPLGQEPSLLWQVQLQVQMLVMQVDTGSLSAFLGAPHVHHRWDDFDRDHELSAIILEETEDFWNSIRRNRPPTTDGSVAAAEVLRRLRGSRLTGKTISLPKKAVVIDRDILRAQHDHDRIMGDLTRVKDYLESRRAEMIALIGENEVGMLPGGAAWTLKQVSVAAREQKAYSYRLLNRIESPSSKKR